MYGTQTGMFNAVVLQKEIRYISSFNITCDPCCHNESECARANFELQTKKVKNDDFG